MRVTSYEAGETGDYDVTMSVSNSPRFYDQEDAEPISGSASGSLDEDDLQRFTGEFADVAFGDPWYRPIEPGEPGKSLIVARTQAGRRAVLAAAEAGYLVLETRDATLLPRSQPNLLRGRGTLWGRLLMLRATGTPAPRYAGFPVFSYWLRKLSFRERLLDLRITIEEVADDLSAAAREESDVPPVLEGRVERRGKPFRIAALPAVALTVAGLCLPASDRSLR